MTAPELASDVAGAERLVARHQDICAEIQARDDDFKQLYAAGKSYSSCVRFVDRHQVICAEIQARDDD